MSSFHFSAINGPVKQLQSYRYTLILPILSLRSFCHLYNSILLKIMKIGLTLCLCLAFSLAWSSNSYKQAQGESDDDKRETVKKFLQHLAARNGNLVQIVLHSLIYSYFAIITDAVVDSGIPGLCYKFSYSCQRASSGSANSFADCCSRGGKSFKPYGSFCRQC